MRFFKKTEFSLPLVLALVLGSTSQGWADMELAPRGGTNSNAEGRTPRRWAQHERMGVGEPMGERLIDRLLANAKLTTEIGVSAENVVKLREESHTIQARRIDLDAEIRKLSLMQTDHMAKLLSAADANTNEVMKTVDQLGQLRTEQAKLAVQNLLVIRKYLTPEQIRKARELMRERMQNNAEARAEKKKEKNGSFSTVAPPPKPPEGF